MFENSDLRYALHEEWMKDMHEGSARERLAAQRPRSRPLPCRLCLAVARALIGSGQRLQHAGMRLGQAALAHSP
jgi:hypothetical protein